jgi:NADPH:quinone reductase-like Zn-dependent oxidoreductase
VFATASNLDKRQTLIDNYGIPESHILNARAAPLDLKRKILRMTNNKGVDVVLNSIAGRCLPKAGIALRLLACASSSAKLTSPSVTT